ncbi:MAG: SpoIIE family protein phosphatase [Brevinematales bacterium]|nr:SpoIIE family protein phosphatase [Brevinematales bacterium]
MGRNPGIFTRMLRFFSGGLYEFTPEQKKEFFLQTEYSLFSRGRFGLILVFTFNIPVIIYFLYNMLSWEQFYMHIALSVFSAAAFLLSFISMPHSHQKINLYNRIWIYGVIFISLLWGAVKTSVDQIAGSPVQVYLLIVYVMASIGIFHAWMSFILFGVSFAVEIIGVSMLQPDMSKAIPIYISSAMFTAIAWMFSLIIFRAQVNNFKNRKIIEQQNGDLIEKENKLEKELDLAKKLQESLLPKNLGAISGVTFYIKYLPLAKVGGDIYDIYKLREGVIRVLLADATGHGVEAGFVTMIIKSEYEKLKTLIDNTAEILEALNMNIIDGYQRINLLFPAIIMDIDTLRMEMRYASAGYNNHTLLRGKSETLALSATGKIVGLTSDMQYTQKILPLRKDDRILLFTDGLYEEFNSEGKEYGYERLMSEIAGINSEKSLEYVVEYLLKSVGDFIGTHTANDDITIVGISLK